MTKIRSIEKAGESGVRGGFRSKVDLQPVAGKGWDAQATGRCRRDSTLLQFTTKQLRDFIGPEHLPIQIDEQLDFAKLVAPLEERYWPAEVRPEIHPEVMVRALLGCPLYNIASFRRLCSTIPASAISSTVSGGRASPPSLTALTVNCCAWVCCRGRCTWTPPWSRPTSARRHLSSYIALSLRVAFLALIILPDLSPVTGMRSSSDGRERLRQLLRLTEWLGQLRTNGIADQ